MSRSLHGSAAIDAERVSGAPASRCTASRTSATWKAMASSAARAMWPGLVPRAKADDACRVACGSQCGAPRPTKAGTKMTPPASGTLAASASTSRGCADEPEVVAQPLDDGSADEDAAFERILEAMLGAGGDGGDELVARAQKLRADVLQEEAAGTVGVLCLARSPAELAEEGGLLIAGDACDWDAAQSGEGGFADALAGPDHLGQEAGWDVEEAEEILVPLAFDHVEQQRARGVGDVGDVMPAAGEVPDQPGVDGAEGQFAALGAIADSGDVVEDPLDLGGRKIGVKDEAGFGGDLFSGAALFQSAAQRSGAAVLPDDGGVDGFAGGAVPEDDGFTLVGDADGRRCRGRRLSLGEHLACAGELGGEDFKGVVLDPAGLRIELLELVLGHSGNCAGVIEEDGARAGGALIEGEDVGHEEISRTWGMAVGQPVMGMRVILDTI